MACQPMNSVTLSAESKKTLKVIADKIKLGNYLKPIMAGGTLFNALVSDKAIPVIFNVTSTDWVTLAQALQSVNAITKRAVQTEIELMILNTTGKENIFWKNMYECY
jgi:hypothetical protein